VSVVLLESYIGYFFLCIHATFARETTPIARESWSYKKEGIVKRTGKKALITGGNGGFGLATARLSLKLWLAGQHQTHVEEMHGSAGCGQF
jgi:hypothetical protein